MAKEKDEDLDLKNGEADDIELEKIDYEPKQNGEWLDFTDLPLNKIYLANKNDILDVPRPSWIPDISREAINDSYHPFIPVAVKDENGNYRIKAKDSAGNLQRYTVTPDLLAITADYYKKRENALTKKEYDERFSLCKEKILEMFKAVFPTEQVWNDYKTNVGNTRITVDEKLSNLSQELKIEKIAPYGKSSVFFRFIRTHLLQNQDSQLNYSDIFNQEKFDEKFKTGFENCVSAGFGKFKSVKWHSGKKTMTHTRCVAMKELCKELSINRSHNEIFKELENERADISQKILDLNYQKLDYIGRFVKGRETSYGDTNLNDALKNQLGVMVKRQDGTAFTQKQLNNLQQMLTKAYSHYGDLGKTLDADGYKISYAADVNQHASKSIGIYFPFYKAIGVSVFGDDVNSASCTLAHEIAHYLDGKEGEKKQRFFATDDANSLEYKIADTFRKNMKNPDLKGYWKRTCECFARALEQYYAVENSINVNPEYNRVANSFFL